jgi:tetratricopeptide (TPR) repeat protein
VRRRRYLESVIEPAARHHALLLNLAQAVRRLGQGDTAGELLREAAHVCPQTADKERSDILFHFANWLITRGQLDEALRIYQFDLLPILERLGYERSKAITQGKIAGILQDRGQLDEACASINSISSPSSSAWTMCARRPCPRGKSPASSRPVASSMRPAHLSIR